MFAIVLIAVVIIVLIVEVILGVIVLIEVFLVVFILVKLVLIGDFENNSSFRKRCIDCSIFRNVQSVNELLGKGETYFTFDFHIILCSFSIFCVSSKSSKSVSCLARTPSS